MTAPAWPHSASLESFRLSGRPFLSQEPGEPAGYYRFETPDAEAPVGPFRTAALAKEHCAESV